MVSPVRPSTTKAGIVRFMVMHKLLEFRFALQEGDKVVPLVLRHPFFDPGNYQPRMIRGHIFQHWT